VVFNYEIFWLEDMARERIHELERKIAGLQELTGYSDNFQAFCSAAGISREGLKACLEDTGRRGLNGDYQRQLSSYVGFSLDWPEWIERDRARIRSSQRRDTAQAFLDRCRNKQMLSSGAEALNHATYSAEMGTAARYVKARLKVGPSISHHVEGKERLASILFGFMQSPAGEPWPAIVELRCQNDTLDQFELAVRRGWLQIEGGQHCVVQVKHSKALQVEGSEGLVSISAPGGKANRTTWDISAQGKFIGVVELPEAFCSIAELAPGDVITARFAAFVKDLENVTDHDDATPEEGAPVNDSLSWRRLGYHTLGAAKQAIMMRVAQLKQLPGADKGWVVLREEQRIFHQDEQDPHDP